MRSCVIGGGEPGGRTETTWTAAGSTAGKGSAAAAAEAEAKAKTEGSERWIAGACAVRMQFAAITAGASWQLIPGWCMPAIGGIAVARRGTRPQFPAQTTVLAPEVRAASTRSSAMASVRRIES